MPNLTHAPLPSGRDIFKAIFSLDGVVKDLAKPWLRDGKELFWFSRSAWSLYFVVKLYMQVRDKKNRLYGFLTIFVIHQSTFCVVILMQKGLSS